MVKRRTVLSYDRRPVGVQLLGSPLDRRVDVDYTPHHYQQEMYMKTIQITIDEPLLEAVDRLTAEMRTNRSAFFRDAAQRALKRHHIAAMEEQHRRGYVERPQTREEVEEWLPEHPTSVALV